MLLIRLVETLFLVYTIMMFVRILSSWFPEYSSFPIIRFISFYVDPYINVFRKMIPPLGMLDLSPIIAFIALRVIESVVINIISWLFL